MLPPRDHSISATFPTAAAAKDGPVRIQLCGRLRVDIEDRHVTPLLRGRQGRTLLAFLVINRGRAVSREELAQAIWPVGSPEHPGAALRTQLSRVRGAMGTGALAGREAIELRLPAEAWIDVEAAEAAIRAADEALEARKWREAWIQAHITINIAGRLFLAEVDAPWVRETRADLKELELRAMETITQAGIGLGGSELAGAERVARALIRAAPFRESGYLNLMRALVAAGNTAEALRTYDTLRTLLATELGSAPGAEAQALHRELLGGR
ncbi:MAG: DNA-binding protein [Solirubrobacterales bacterium]|nr:DNA-binding protein [Solirubrobacterales bacterium]